MKLKFKIQEYQTNAINSVIKVFNGQLKYDNFTYNRDLGKKINKDKQESLYNDENPTGYKNADLKLDDDMLLKNINKIQFENNIKKSNKIEKIGIAPAIDIEMETGTGKTYVYIKTMFELNKIYGWSKFIIVVPNVAIREGVKKSFDITADHFMEYYGKKARYFIYNSSNLNELDQFSSSADINVMIINIQAFNTSFKENGTSKEARIIYDVREEFRWRRPIDVIASNNPIIILDEPQKMSGDKTQKALAKFNPLFFLNYSATHVKKNNLVYVLDAVDAYKEKLVKRIEVKGFSMRNFRGTESYLYLDEIIVSPTKPPKARIELEINYKKSINREKRLFDSGDNLYNTSYEMEQYKGYVISEIDPINQSVIFTNGEVLRKGDICNDISQKDMRRVQIRETIKSHFEKESTLFKKGIKTLSLFFIDEVANYREYDEENNPKLGEYGEIFEEEYKNIFKEKENDFEKDYLNYLKNIEVEKTHNGYFSIDKKTGQFKNSEIKRGSDSSDDISAYDLILKNKERLLSFEEPTRFIFSHSALREGWDNPNVFQICTLKHSDSNIGKRQEVGRGLRLCVNQNGDRMDLDYLGEKNVHNINLLTVITSESYKNFVSDLQKDMKDTLYDRPTKANKEYFLNSSIKVNGNERSLTEQEATAIYQYLVKNEYIDENEKVTQKYKDDLENGSLAEVNENLKDIEDYLHQLVQAIYDENILENMFSDGNATKILKNELNDNFYKKEFQELWNLINHKYAYKVNFETDELIKNSVQSINKNLHVSELSYTISIGQQKDNFSTDDVKKLDSFEVKEGLRTEKLSHSEYSSVKYDLIGKIATNTVLTRNTIVKILSKISEGKFNMFKQNPEEFISKVSRYINEEKATIIVNHIIYKEIEGKYDSEIFTAENKGKSFKEAFKAKKHIQDYVFTDGISEKSVERNFVEQVDNCADVIVYAKLPKGFYIPTPVGNYSPDWAISFKEGTVKHVYFIAETKGSLSSLQLKPIETAKIESAKILFDSLSNENLKYDKVDSFECLIDLIGNKKINK